MNKKLNEPNVLFILHSEFITLAQHFRERVCEECNFSVPTFYRKTRSKDKIIEGKHVPALSNAERDKIREIGANLKNEFDKLISDIMTKK